MSRLMSVFTRRTLDILAICILAGSNVVVYLHRVARILFITNREELYYITRRIYSFWAFDALVHFWGTSTRFTTSDPLRDDPVHAPRSLVVQCTPSYWPDRCRRRASVLLGRVGQFHPDRFLCTGSNPVCFSLVC